MTLVRHLGRRANAEPDARLVARHEIGHGRDVRQPLPARRLVTASARSLPALTYSSVRGLGGEHRLRLSPEQIR